MLSIKGNEKIMKPELLSPAGDMDSLKAGIYGGCDAVYLGGPKFSARAYATNFTEADLKGVIDYAHTYGVKVYITINTLLKDSEIPEAYAYAVRVWNMGCDAIIIQDPGLIYLLQRFNPGIELHASTQMTIHNQPGAAYYTGKGIRRIVLARELSLPEIKEISREIETEVFIHGALCIAYSGKCLMSSMLSGRSGNRGRCAQNCRMHYRLTDEGGEELAAGFLMSPKDLNTLKLIGQLTAAGTKSLKIEGRMKRREYVYETVKEYRKALDGGSTDDSGIRQLFNREGFTEAFLLRNEGRDMMSFHNPKNTGVFLGTVKHGGLQLTDSLHLGDGIKNGETGFIATKLMKDGQAVKSARAGEQVQIYPIRYKDGDQLYKTSDQELLKLIDEKLNEKFPKRWDIQLETVFVPGREFTITCVFRGETYTVTGPIPEVSINNPLTEERLIESLKKTGDSPFQITDVKFTAYSPGFLRISALNELRRGLLEELAASMTRVDHAEEAADVRQLQAVRVLPAAAAGEVNSGEGSPGNAAPEEDSHGYATTGDEIPGEATPEAAAGEPGAAGSGGAGAVWPEKFAILSEKPQLKAFLEIPGNKIMPIFYPFHRHSDSITMADVEAFDKTGQPYMVKCPEIIRGEMGAVNAFIDALPNVRGLLTDNPGLFKRYGGSLPLIGDYKLNILNSYGAPLYPEIGLFSVSMEINGDELSRLTNKAAFLPVVYGRTELMISQYCPVGATVGGVTKSTPCSMPCRTRKFSLTDDKGETFPVMTDLFCRSYIMNGKPVNNLDLLREYRRKGFQRFRIDLTNEDYQSAKELLAAFDKEESVTGINYTRGHYKRGID